jgi:hypothetical protein
MTLEQFEEQVTGACSVSPLVLAVEKHAFKGKLI